MNKKISFPTPKPLKKTQAHPIVSYSKPLIITGPTTCGKTEIAINIADKTNGNIIAGWPVEMYTGFPLSTCSLDLRDNKNISLYNTVSPFDEPLTLQEYTKRFVSISGKLLKMEEN